MEEQRKAKNRAYHALSTVNIDPAAFAACLFLGIEKKQAWQSNEQKKTKDGIPIWTVRALVFYNDGREEEKIKVDIPSSKPIQLDPQTPIVFQGLSFTTYIFLREEDGKPPIYQGSGTSYKAETLKLLRR